VALCGTGLHPDNVEQAVTNELFQNERHTTAGGVFNVTPEDTSNILNGNKSSPNFGTTIRTVSDNLATLRKSNTRQFTAGEIIRFFLVEVGRPSRRAFAIVREYNRLIPFQKPERRRGK